MRPSNQRKIETALGIFEEHVDTHLLEQRIEVHVPNGSPR
jgi:hypothetical protein